VSKFVLALAERVVLADGIVHQGQAAALSENLELRRQVLWT
jgi:hypothetical protein